jgi:transposase
VARLTTAGVRWISRVPDTSKEARTALSVPDDAWQQEGELCWAADRPAPTGERWVVVRTTQGEERVRTTVRRQMDKTGEQWEKALWHLGTQRFACAPDARAALEQQLKQRPAWLRVQTQLVEHPQHGQPGRPRTGATPDRTEWEIQATLAVDEAAVAQAVRRQASFLVATNVLDRSQLSDQELIWTYQEQHRVEIVCSQMTKTDLLAGGSGRDHVVNLHVGVGDDHAVNQEFDELPLLLPGCLS